MSKHAKRRKKQQNTAKNAATLLLCALCLCAAAFLLWETLRPAKETDTAPQEEPYRPEVGDPPYRVAVDAGHGGTDPGASGVVRESDMTAATAAELTALLEADANYIPLASRESYDTTAKPAERVETLNALSPDLLLSIHGNSAPEGSTASGFECYPTVPGRTYHRESLYFARLLADGMGAAGAALRGNGGVRYIYYLENDEKQLVEVTHDEVRAERSFRLLEDVDCPAVLAEQCFVTNAEDVDAFGDEDGCKRAARIYYEAICAYFGTEPMRDTTL